MGETIRSLKNELYSQLLNDALKQGQLENLEPMIESLSPSELADLLESLPTKPRNLLWSLIETESDGEVLAHLNEEARASLIEITDDQELIQATQEMELDDLADIIRDFPEQVTRGVLAVMDREDRDRLTQVLSYEEHSAGGLMNPEVLTVRRSVSLDVVSRYLRMRESLPKVMDHLYVVDRDGLYLGKLAIADLLTKPAQTRVLDLMNDDEPAIMATTADTEVAAMFEHLDWISAPVVDENNRLVGYITIDDIVDVIREEAERSVKSMGGLDETDDMFAPILSTSSRRALFLGLNLITALIAAICIDLFSATIDQIVALAVLMPIVASMGGIAGTQTLTLTIRGMALGQVVPSNTRPLMNKEIAVGLLNGLLWAIVTAGIAVVWFKDGWLSLVVGVAIFLNLVAGAAAGVIVPIVLKRFDIDPALAGGMVLTTVTDVVGFVSILGLGTVLLLQ